jgi:hydroxymethylpyrimidine pyrophosphatase-like HAD family hydrolase
MPVIKAVIADVDGVMVGKTPDYNFPLPHAKELDAMECVSAHGVPIILCTAKFGAAIKDITLKANLHNLHITDGGAAIVQFSDNTILKKYVIPPETVQMCIQECLDHGLYIELFTIDDYYIDESHINAFTTRRSRLLQKEPICVTSLLKQSKTLDVIKVIVFVRNDEQKARLAQLAGTWADAIHFIWSFHPYLAPSLPAVITAKNVSKAAASQYVATSLGIDFSQILGIGDSESDWNFMQLCGFVGTVGDQSSALIRHARNKADNHYYIAPSVDEHGLIDIFKNFKLL